MFGFGSPVIPEVDAATVKDWLDAGEAVLIDVRETPEYQRAHIAGALLVPLSAFDPRRIPQNGEKVVLACAMGRRSASAIAHLMGQGFKNLYNLQGGLNSWAGAGLPLEMS
ncbi:MAG: rhodanese-like domain-containing protein [Alphaproteobacteria bacterium]|nr:rhodanese-like domain-containing protein [Alphaproteobacteria bacterium]